ncbi:unnamed protein product [Symbiodinium microadriaticum]|nr:unnamed protein product [Symbiodinium microadriaticum]
MRYAPLGFFIVGASLVLFTPQIWKQRAIQHSINLLEQLQIQVGPVPAEGSVPGPEVSSTSAAAAQEFLNLPQGPQTTGPQPPATAGPAPVIPLVYVWFCGEVSPINSTDPQQLRWDIKTNCAVSEYFAYAVGASLIHVPKVVLISDVPAAEKLKARYPADLAEKLHIVNYFDYVDEKFWIIRKLYEDHLKIVRGYREPFEKWNVLNFFVFRKYLEKERVPAAGFAEGDVAVMVPPFIPRGCDGEIAWRDKLDRNKPWGPFQYCALASMGGVLSLDIMNDWTDFNIELYRDHFWIQRAVGRFSIVHAINQMHTWYFYAMGSLDYEGMPWSDGEPWYLQYVRRHPNWTREHMWMMKYDGRELPYPNATLPATKRYRLCNGYWAKDGYVIDSAHGWIPALQRSASVEGKLTTTYNGSQMIAQLPGNVTFRNYHFQGQAKNQIKNIFAKSFQAHGGFKW